MTGFFGLMSWLRGNPPEEFKGKLLWGAVIMVFGAVVLTGQLIGGAFFDPVPVPEFTYSIENISK